MPLKDSSKAISRGEALLKREALEKTDEEIVVAAIKKEADAFVPNVLPMVKRKTGTFSPIETQEELSLTAILGIEGSKIVPNIGKDILEKTGIKAKWMPFQGWTARRAFGVIGTCLSFVFIVGAAAATTPINSADVAPGALLRVSIAPASVALEKDEGEAKVAYTPEFSLVSTCGATVMENGLIPLNLSASYVTSSIEAPDDGTSSLDEVVSDLIESSYKNGYIEARDPGKFNEINVSLYTDQSDYERRYVSLIWSAMSKAIEDNRLYASVSFSITKAPDILSNLSYDDAAEIFRCYELFGKTIAYDDLLDESASVIFSIGKIASVLSSTRISDRARESLARNMARSYRVYRSRPGEESSSSPLSDLKDEMEERGYDLPWGIEDLDVLKSDPYYLFLDPATKDDFGGMSSEAVDLFIAIQKAIFLEAAESKEKYLSFLDAVYSYLLALEDDPSSFPSPYGGGYDPGGHHPGNGPDSPSWGSGEAVAL